MKTKNFPDTLGLDAKWKLLEAFCKKGNSVVGEVVKYSKYWGFTVDLGGINANVPLKVFSYGYIKLAEDFVGHIFSFKILSIDIVNKNISLSRKALVGQSKAGDILNGIIVEVCDSYITADVGFACRVFIDNLKDRFVRSIRDEFRILEDIKLVLLDDFQQKRFTLASTQKSVVWKNIIRKYSENQIITVSISFIKNNFVFVNLDDCNIGSIHVSKLTKESQEKFYKKELEIGERLEVVILEFDESRYYVNCSEVLARSIKRRKIVEEFELIHKVGDKCECEVLNIHSKEVEVKTGPFVGRIERNELSWNEIERNSALLYEGEYINAVYIGVQDELLQFSVKRLYPIPYSPDLYDLDLHELLEYAGHSSNIFVGYARSYGTYTFIENLYSVDGTTGKLLVDPIYGYNLRALLLQPKGVVEGETYKVKISLLPKDVRLNRNQLFQFSCAILEKVENPYDKDITDAFRRNTTNPNSNARDAHLLAEIGKDTYCSKDRIFYELIQNADDASSQSGVTIQSYTEGDYLFFIHNGLSLNREDFLAITSAANGTKKANSKATGYKGIGFKSVFTDSECVYINSGGYHFKFDKQDERFTSFDKFYCYNRVYEVEKLKKDFLELYASDIEKFQGVNDIPWQLEPIVVKTFPEMFKQSFMQANVAIAMKMGEYNIGGELGYAAAIEDIISEPKFMLFLRNTSRISFNSKTISRIVDNDKITLKNSFSDVRLAQYRKFDYEIPISNEEFEKCNLPIKIVIEEKDNDGNFKKAYFANPAGVRYSNMPEKMAVCKATEISFALRLNHNGDVSPIYENELSLFSFLPTLVKEFIFTFYINANFILDPSRQRISGDNPWNIFLFRKIAECIVELCAKLAKEGAENALNFLPIEYFDEKSSDIKFLSAAFNDSYRNSIENKAFILNDLDQLSLQQDIILDDFDLSESIGNDNFYKILGESNRRLPSLAIKTIILYNSIFSKCYCPSIDTIKEKIKNFPNLSDWYIRLDDDIKHKFNLWLVENKCKEIIVKIPSLPFGQEWKSIEELSNNKDYLVLNEHLKECTSLLEKLGFSCTLFMRENHDFCDFIPKLDEKDLFNSIIKRCTKGTLSSSEKLKLFQTNFDGIGEETLKKVALFNNLKGNPMPLCEMEAYKESVPTEILTYVICKEENFAELQCFLIPQEEEFSKIVWQHRSDFGVSIASSYEGILCNDGVKVKELINEYCNTDSYCSLLPLVLKSGSDVKRFYVNKILRLDISSDVLYDQSSFQSQILHLAIETLERPSDFSQVIYVDGKCMAEFSISDNVELPYTQGEKKNIIKLSLCKLLPEYGNQTFGIESFKRLFEKKSGLEKLFEAKNKPLMEIYDEMHRNLILSDRELAKWPKFRTKACQYLFSLYYRVHVKNWFNTYVPNIELGVEGQDFVNDLLNTLYENKVDIGQSPFNSRLSAFFDKKYFSSKFILETEKLLPTIEEWADSQEKREYLLRNGVKDETASDIVFRKKFLSNRISSISSDLICLDTVQNTINYFVTKCSDQLPFIGDKQIAFLVDLYNEKDVLERKVCVQDLLDCSVELDSKEYHEWAQSNETKIFLYPGRIIRKLKYNDILLATYPTGDYYYSKSKDYLFINNEKNINRVLFDCLNDKNCSVINDDDYSLLCLYGKISISQDEFNSKLDTIQELTQENQNKDIEISRLKARLESFENKARNCQTDSSSSFNSVPQKSDEQIRREYWESSVKELLGDAFQLSKGDIKSENIITRWRVLNYLKENGTDYQISRHFSKNDECDYVSGKSIVIPLADGRNLISQSCKGGIWYISPNVWRGFKEQNAVVCMCTGNDDNDFSFAEDISDIEQLANTANVLVKISPKDEHSMMDSIKSVFPGEDNYKMDIHLMVRVNKNSCASQINSIFDNAFNSVTDDYEF